jgi:hypothetical protein
MTHFDDLSDYEYSPKYRRPGTRNIGWLEAGYEYEKQEPREEVLEKLWRFCKIEIALARGGQFCAFCADKRVHFAEKNGERLLLGVSEIRVFSKGKTIYAAPSLVYHYMKAHSYKPPDEFLHALEEGPVPPDENYFDRLRELDLI